VKVEVEGNYSRRHSGNVWLPVKFRKDEDDESSDFITLHQATLNRRKEEATELSQPTWHVPPLLRVPFAANVSLGFKSSPFDLESPYVYTQ
jgi:hypothetical protein